MPAPSTSVDPPRTSLSAENSRFIRIRNATAPFAGALIVLAFGVLMYFATLREQAAVAAVGHTHAVIEQNDAMLTRLVDAETGERGYIITGDSAFLQPYRGAREAIVAHLDTLHRLTADNPSHLARLDTVTGLVTRRLAMLDRRNALRTHAGFDSVRVDFNRTGGGKPLMDSVRALIAAIDGTEQLLLAERTKSKAVYERSVVIVAVVGALVAALSALLINLLLARSATIEARLAGEVRERAQELEVMNEQLSHQASTLEEQAVEMEALNEELQSSNEELAQRTLEAESANRVKAQFLANMSHDLRTPLNAVVGYVDLLKMGIQGPLTPLQLESLDRIERSSGHLRTLVSDVLEYAKIEAGKVQLRIEPVTIAEVLDGVHPVVARQAEEKGIALTHSCPAILTARADREKVEQILLNLVDNAIKFTDRGGSVHIDCTGAGVEVSIEVRDTGRGIPSESLESVFEPFVQVDAKRVSAEPHGVGLGLAISRELAMAMSGDVGVTSTLGEGSTFTLTLPKA
jgi:signal transduction histidine kinase